MDKEACKGCPRQFSFKEPSEFNAMVLYADYLIKKEKKLMYGLGIKFSNSWDEYYFVPVKDELEKFRNTISTLKTGTAGRIREN